MSDISSPDREILDQVDLSTDHTDSRPADVVGQISQIQVEVGLDGEVQVCGLGSNPLVALALTVGGVAHVAGVLHGALRVADGHAARAEVRGRGHWQQWKGRVYQKDGV